MQDLVWMHDDDVGAPQETQLARLERALRDRGHRDGLEVAAQEGKLVELPAGVPALHFICGAQRDFLRPTTTRDQADPGLDQPDVGLERGDAAVAVQDEFAAAAQCHAAHGSHRRHPRVAQAQRRLLEARDRSLDALPVATLDRGRERGEVRPERKGLGRLPDDQRRKIALGKLDRSHQGVKHAVRDSVLPGPERHDADVGFTRPQPQRIGLEDRRAAVLRLAENRVGIALATVHRQ